MMVSFTTHRKKLKSALVMPGAVPLTLSTSSTSLNRMNGRPLISAAAPCGMATSCTVKVPGRIKPREIGAKAYVAGAVNGRSKMQVAVALPGAVEAKAVKHEPLRRAPLSGRTRR